MKWHFLAKAAGHFRLSSSPTQRRLTANSTTVNRYLRLACTAMAMLCSHVLAAGLSITFDPVGNMASQTDARGYELSHTYDALDRVTTTKEYAAISTASPSPTGVEDKIGCQR